MSSTAAADSMKKAADEPAADEPGSKRTKIVAPDDEASAGNNGTGNSNTELGNGKPTATTKTPSKVHANGDSSHKKPGDEFVRGPGGKSGDCCSDEECSDEDDDEDSTGVDAGFDPKITQHLEQVENIQIEICNLNEKASEEILKVEQKFNKLRRPHFEKRNELLKEIPNFWLTSLANHPIIGALIDSAEDEDCLHHMVNLDVEEFEDIKSGYKLKFHFRENPYITNEVIVKEFRLVNSDDVLSSSTLIVYKDTPQGKALKATVDESIAHYRRSRERPNRTHHSFFSWLTEHSDSGPDEVADILKDQIWPNPLEFFFQSPEGLFGGHSGTDTSDDEDEEIENIDDEELDDEEEAVITEGNYSELDDEDIDEEGEEDDDDDEADENVE